MAKFQNIIGTQVDVTGNTTLVISDTILRNSTQPVWPYGCFGISVSRFGAVNFSCHILGDIGGVSIVIAGLTGIGSTLSQIIPILQQSAINTQILGTTQQTFLGIPTPRTIVFGNSGIVGGTYAAVVSAMLYSPDA